MNSSRRWAGAVARFADVVRRSYWNAFLVGLALSLEQNYVLKKKEFLCAVDYDEAYFDFHCVHGGHPKGKAKWYTICGTPFDNRAEYITVVSTITLLALGIFWNIYFNTAKHQIHSLQETKSISTKKQKFQ
ncbi:hypothetical protein J6590_044668 [Homalodisca vitripennis]|nr:hypothetical protein J6590_044668 [Homalodisca vitripennis]